MSRKDVEDRIKELRTPKRGYGAFGESERWEPSQDDQLTAMMLENLLLKLDVLTIKVSILENYYESRVRNSTS
jgi:hypothetical protein